MSSSSQDPQLYLFLGVLAGPCLFFWGFVLRGRKKLIESIPTSKIRSLAVGLVEVSGCAAPCAGKVLASPFSGTECVYYRYRVEELRGSGKRRHWATIASGESRDEFCVQDETGQVRVLPSGADLHFKTDRTYSTDLFGAEREVFLAGLRRLGIGSSGFFRTLRGSETYLMPGEPVYVMGTAQSDASREMTERDVEHLVIAKGEQRYFCISDRSERELLSSMALKMYLFLYGGPVLTAFCLYVLVYEYGWFR